ncbi:MAG: enoyl-CoA hydratase/isomerase family protein [Myxococcales bacterium]|nr:enoyl-CoA hydratase/isomerase family protein [Myxococcales bacterium]
MKYEQHDHVGLLRMEAGKANAMSPELIAGLDRLLDELKAARARAAVITGYDKYFSAGLALTEIIDFDRPRMKAFIDSFSRVMMRIFSLEIPVVAAINGHAIAGGCVLGLMADERLMAEREVKIGLNEVQIGIGLPPIVIEPLRLQVPPTSLVPIAIEGQLLTPHEALELKLVEKLMPENDLEGFALSRAKSLCAAPPMALAQVKRSLRGPVRERLERDLEKSDPWLDTWFSEEAQQRLRAAVAKLRG